MYENWFVRGRNRIGGFICFIKKKNRQKAKTYREIVFIKKKKFDFESINCLCEAAPVGISSRA